MEKIKNQIFKVHFNKAVFTLIISCALINCDNSNEEKRLLKKKNPIGLYGETITKNKYDDLQSILSQPQLFVDKEILTSGKILEVCPMRGCWISISDPEYSERTIRVKVVDGEIVFPLSSKGKNVNVQGVFDKIEFSYEQAKKWKIHLEEEKGNIVNPDSIIVEADDLIEYRIIGKSILIF